MSFGLNPVTKSLIERISDQELVEFVMLWSGLEELVIRVYRSNRALNNQISVFSEITSNLNVRYPAWESKLAYFWKSLKVGKKPILADPFNRLLALESIADIIGDPEVIQILSVTRDAINKLLIDTINKQEKR